MIDVHTAPTSLDLEPVFALAAEAVRSGEVPSAVIGISTVSGTLAIRAFPGPDDPATADSLFFLASLTKPIVATAVMQLVDEGRLDLMTPISRVVPDFSGPGKDAVTVWHVLTHTAGIGDVDHDVLRRKRPTYRRMLDRVCREELAFTPGTRYAYGSDSFYLLAETVSRLTGMPFAEALRRRVLAPLSMNDTTFDPRAMRRRLLQVHGIALGNPLTRELMLRFLAKATLPGGGLFSTAEDLLRFGRALLPRTSAGDPGPRILSQAAIDEMTREQTEGILEIADDGSTRDPRYALGWRKPDPDGAMPSVLGIAPEADTVVPASVSSFTHGGASGARLWIDPDRDLVFVFLSNQWGLPDAPMYATLAALYRAWDAAHTIVGSLAAAG
jgi:CubicO group peptidase (beta-lactamase class C family)